MIALSACSSSTSAVDTEVTVVVDSVSVEGVWLSASAHIDGVAETGGLCWFTFWSDGGGASRLTSSGRVDGARTSCEPVEERILTLWPGDYELVVTYHPVAGDDGASVESTPVSFVVPEH